MTHLPVLAIALAWSWLLVLWVNVAWGDPPPVRMSHCPYSAIERGYTCTIRHHDGGHTEVRLSRGELYLYAYEPVR